MALTYGIDVDDSTKREMDQQRPKRIRVVERFAVKGNRAPQKSCKTSSASIAYDMFVFWTVYYPTLK